MEKKDNDLLLNIVANPQFSLEDFATIGFNITNTSLQDKEVYKNNPLIQKTFSNDEGKFDDKQFTDAYNKALIDYNTMSQKDFYKNQEKQAVYHRDNFDAPVEQRRTGPDFRQVLVSNPDRISSSITRLGEVGERTKSTDELAQASRVLLNPTEVYKNGDADWSKAEWGTDAHDGFFDYFFDTLVMAQWDADGTHIDPVTGQEAQHKKGDLKIGEDGSYFYEKLDGRDIYGRRVLNKMNVLTEDGSTLNKYDFFDSDDINQKSVGGSILKNAALVGTMFIPYVGPVVAGLSIATQLAGLGATLGKMIVGSDSPTLSAIEGWSKSVGRQGATSEYAQNNTWCWENFINLIGDVAGQLKEQRFIFEKIPAAITGKYVGSTKAYNKELENLTNKYLNIAEDTVDTLRKANKPFESIRAAQELGKVAPLKAQAEMDSFIKGYNKIGEILSKGYMTAITVGDTYGEAKAAGASDLDATLLTLGYAAGEYAILNTGIGEWILPELRANKFKNKAIIDTLAKLDDETQNLRESFRQGLKNIPKENKKEYVKKVFNLGRDIATASYVNGSRKGKQLLTASLAAGAGEGVEEVSEELLADFSKGCYNVVNWLRGEDTRMSSFGFQWDDDKNMSWDGKELFDRYSMSLIGGAVGGSLTNLGTTYRMTQDLSKMDRRKAIQEIVYMARNGGLDDLRKQIKQMEFGDKNLSATEFVEVDGKLTPKPGTSDNNQDQIVKKALNDQISFIENILNAEGTNISDDSFLDKQSLGDLRFNALHNSVTAGRFMQEFNSLNTRLIQLIAKKNQITVSSEDTNKDNIVTDKEKRNAQLSDTQKADLQNIEQQIKDTRKSLKDLMEGKRADEFIGDALYEMTTALSGRKVPITFPLWLKYTKGKNYSEFSATEKEELKKQYRIWKETEAKDDIHLAASVYRDMAAASSKVIKEYEQQYLKRSENIKNIDSLVANLYNITADSNEEWLQESDKRNKLISLVTQFSDKLGIDGYKQLFDSLSVEENNIINSTTLSDDEKRQKLKNAQNKYTSKLHDLLFNNIGNYITQFVQQGYANTETKNQLKRIVNFLKGNLLSQISDLQGKIEEEMDSWQPDEDVVNSLNADFDKVQTLLSKLTPLEEQIDSLNNTPFEESLNQFAISIGKDPINITQLIQKVNQLFAESSGDLTGFNLSGETARELNSAIETMDLYQEAILGARTDALSLDNLFGYNVTLNEVAEKIGKKLDLAEIDSNYADILYEDINVNKNKLEFLRTLYKVNKGQRLSKQQRVGARASVLLFNKLKTFVSVPDDDPIKQSPEFQQLELVINSLKLHNDLSNNSKSFSLSDEDKLALQSEEIKLRDELHNFLNAIDDNTLIRLLNPDKLNLWDRAENLLNENLTEIDGNAFVWWLASSAAVKASNFYAKYNQSLDPKSKILPIPTQEIAIYNNYASIVNGDVFTRFQKAFRASIKQEWENKSIEARKQVLSKLNQNPMFAENIWAKYCFNFLPIPRYQNIVLTEGIPGSGKTSGVFQGVVNLLKVTHPELLDNVRIVHCADIKDSKTESQATKLQKNLDVKSKASDAQTFMEEIVPNYKPYPINNDIYQVDKSDYEITKDDKEIKSKLGINNNSDNVPSLIIIDEVTKLTAYDLDLIDKYAKTHGITVLVAGDYDQNGVVGQHDVSINEQSIPWIIDTNRINFPRCPKLGVSMRTDNTIMSDDLSFFQEWMKDPSQRLDLNYYEDETGLYGIKNVFNTDVNYVVQEVKKLISTLKKDDKGNLIEKIGFIGVPGSQLTAELSKDEYKDYIEIKEGDSAQGSEGQYYIIEGGYDQDYKNKKWLRRVYTGLSRASQGALLAISPEIPINTKAVSEKIDETGTESGNLQYMAQRKEILNQVAISTEDIPYNPRTKEKIVIDDTQEEPTEEPTKKPDEEPVSIEYTKEKQIEKWGDRMGISSIDVEVDGNKQQLQLVSISSLWNAENKTVYGKFNVIDYDDRKIVLVKIGNFIQPFYCSTGLAGKSTPHTWQPFFGIGSMPKDYDGPAMAWLNKTTEDDIRNYYYNPILEAIGHRLDELFGTELRDVNLGPNMLYNYNDADWIQQINTSFPNSPDNYNTRGTNVYQNVEYAKTTITQEWEKLNQGESKPEESIVPFFKVGDYLTETIGDKKVLYLVQNISEDDIVTLLNTETNQVQKKDLSIIEAQLNQNYTITTKEDLVSPLEDDDETPLIDPPSSEPEYKKELDDKNEDENLPSNAISVEQDAIHLDMILHSFNTYESGVVYDLITESILSSPDRMAARRDSINGLKKAEQILGKSLLKSSEKPVTQYLDIIGRIRQELYNTKEIDKICEKVSRILGISGLQCSFALKCSPTHSDTDREYVSSNPDAFGTSKREHVEHHNSVAENSQKVQAHRIVAIFKTAENGEFLEIPVLSLTSPFTFIQIVKNGQKVFPDLDETYNQLKERGVQKHIIIEELLRICNTKPQYRNIGNLLRLYNYTFNGLFRIPDPNWTPSKNLVPQGIHFVQKAGHYYDEDSGRKYESDQQTEKEWMTVEQFAKDRQFNVTSKVLVSRSEKLHELGIVNRGHPFVLVTSDPKLYTDQKIVDKFLEEQQNNSSIQSVKLMYIMPPAATAKDYLVHLEKLLHTKKADIDATIKENIGNLFTPYRVLDILRNDTDGKELIEQYAPGLLNQLNPILDHLNSFGEDIDAIKSELSTPVLTNTETPIKLITYLGQILTHIAYNKGMKIDVMQLNPQELSIDQHAVDIISKALEKANHIIRHKVKIRGESQQIGMFKVADQTKGFMIDGKPCKIHGKVDQMSYTGNLDELVDYWISTIKVQRDKKDPSQPRITSNGKVMLWTDQRGAQNYIPFTLKNEQKPAVKKPVITEAGKRLQKDLDKVKDIIQLDNVPDLFSLTEQNRQTYLNTIVDKINQTVPDRIAFVVNGELLVSKPTDFFKGGKTIQGQIIPKQKFEITVVENGQKVNYTADYDNGKLTIVNNVQPAAQSTIDFNTLYSLKDVYNSQLNDLMDSMGCGQFNDLFNTASLEDFINAARQLDYIDKETFDLLVSYALDSIPNADDSIKKLLQILSEVNEDNNPSNQKPNEGPTCGLNQVISML